MAVICMGGNSPCSCYISCTQVSTACVFIPGLPFQEYLYTQAALERKKPKLLLQKVYLHLG